MWGGLEAREVNLLIEPENLPERLEVQVRYRTRPVPARVEAMGAGRLVIRLEEPQFAVTSGQSAVLYQGERLLGGGFIARPLYNALGLGRSLIPA
jgi:tRNA-specific 2-thiouridylase